MCILLLTSRLALAPQPMTAQISKERCNVIGWATRHPLQHRIATATQSPVPSLSRLIIKLTLRVTLTHWSFTGDIDLLSANVRRPASFKLSGSLSKADSLRPEGQPKICITFTPHAKQQCSRKTFMVHHGVAYRYRKSISIIELFISIYIGFLATNF